MHKGMDKATAEACAAIADRWAHGRGCNVHDDDPCCHVRMAIIIAAVIREETGLNDDKYTEAEIVNTLPAIVEA